MINPKKQIKCLIMKTDSSKHVSSSYFLLWCKPQNMAQYLFITMDDD